MSDGLTKSQSKRKLSVRPARSEDASMLFEWANDAQVRASSFSPAPILWENHLAWFESKLRDADCRVFIGLDENENPIGQVRFDRTADGEAEIDISVDGKRRGGGIGGELLEAAAAEFFRTSNARVIHAFVKTENVGSIRAFEKANFRRIGTLNVKGSETIHFVRTKDD